ncbi:MAG: hypothetical protein ACYC8T_39350 [Myxococcaceae bacterium]
MAHATIEGRKHLVRVTQDLTDNWAVEVYPEPTPGKLKTAEPYKPWPVPLTMKVKADTREDALMCVLEQMKKLGRISDFHVEENEKPKPPPAKPAPAPVAAAAAKPAAAAPAATAPAAAAPAATAPAAAAPASPAAAPAAGVPPVKAPAA